MGSWLSELRVSVDSRLGRGVTDPLDALQLRLGGV